MLGFETKYTITVSEVEPKRLCRMTAELGPWDIVFRLEPDGDTTCLILGSEYVTEARPAEGGSTSR